MKSKRYSVEQIVAVVKPHEQGTTAVDICRKLGIAEVRFSAGELSMAGWSQMKPGN